MSIAVDHDQPNINRRIGRAVAAALKARGATGRQIGVVLGLSKAQIRALRQADDWCQKVGAGPSR